MMQVDRPAWPDETAEPDETSQWALTVIGGPWAGTRLAWDRAGMVLGREAVGAAVFRGDRVVSRRHAVLRVVDGNCVVEDDNSTNGTFINDVPVDRPTVLGPEDELRIGSTRLRLAPALAGTALLDAVPAEIPEDGTAGGGPTAPQHQAGAGIRAADGARARQAGQLSFTVLAAVAGTVLASALNGSPQLRLAAAAVGSAVPAFITEPGRHQRARVTAAVVVMAIALFVTYGGATLFSYVTDHPTIYPVLPAMRPKTHRASPAPTQTSYLPSPSVSTPVSAPTVTGTPTPPPPSPSTSPPPTSPPPPPPPSSYSPTPPGP
jgi:hypothetical protein